MVGRPLSVLPPLFVVTSLAVFFLASTQAACRKQPAAPQSPTPTPTNTPRTDLLFPTTTSNPQSPISNLPSPALLLLPTAALIQPPAAPASTTGTPFDLSRYRFRVSQAADDALVAGDYQTALTLYRQVIEDNSLLPFNPGLFLPPTSRQLNGHPLDLTDPAEPDRLAAYAYFRLMLVYAAQDEGQRVLLTNEIIQGTFPPESAGHPYALLAAQFWRRYPINQDISYACSRVRIYADDHLDEVITPLGDAFYGWLGRGYSRDDLCPFT